MAPQNGETTDARARVAPAASTPAKKIGFVSLGCPKNLVDSEVMMGILHRAGAEITTSAHDADIIVVNTCSFIDSAKQESVDTILEMAQHKQASGGRAQKLVVAGCLVERYRDEIRKNIPEVDAVVGTGELDAILAASGLQTAPAPSLAPSPFNILVDRAPSAVHVHSRPEGDARERAGRYSRSEWEGAIAQLPNYLMDEHTPRLLATGRTSAYLKIAEGCDHPCSFCIIPQLRGKFRSRHFESVVAEARALVANGAREITLIGQDTTCYGEDLGLKDGLADLLDRLARIDGLRWLRFLYAYPNKITGKLLDSIARYDNIAPYMDVPLQHASPTVLKRMKRGGSADIFLKQIDKMRTAIPGLVLRTSFIVGFPGETEAEFNELHDFVKAARFDWMGVFSYSDEQGANAFALAEKIDAKEIERRRRKLMSTQKAISRKLKKQWIGRELDVLAEGPSEETDLLWEGRTILHAPEIDGKVFINDFGDLDSLERGAFYRAEITEAHDYDVIARILRPI